jgi:hypothetical protein
MLEIKIRDSLLATYEAVGWLKKPPSELVNFVPPVKPKAVEVHLLPMKRQAAVAVIYLLMTNDLCT